MQERAAETPKEIQDITARILPLRERLKKGDPVVQPTDPTIRATVRTMPPVRGRW